MWRYSGASLSEAINVVSCGANVIEVMLPPDGFPLAASGIPAEFECSFPSVPLPVNPTRILSSGDGPTNLISPRTYGASSASSGSVAAFRASAVNVPARYVSGWVFTFRSIIPSIIFLVCLVIFRVRLWSWLPTKAGTSSFPARLATRIIGASNCPSNVQLFPSRLPAPTGGRSNWMDASAMKSLPMRNSSRVPSSFTESGLNGFPLIAPATGPAGSPLAGRFSGWTATPGAGSCSGTEPPRPCSATRPQG